MSSKPVLWITRKLSANTEARAQRDYEVLLNPEDQPNSADHIIEMSHRVDAILPCHSEVFNADVVSQLDERVKIIANHSVGVDHCDLTALQARVLLLGAARRAAEGDRLVRDGRWSSWSPAFMVGKQVTGKRLGILGMGKVGQVMAKRARGFDMQVHYHNRQRLEPSLEHNATFHDSLESLLSVSDFLSLHCPATEHTQGLINATTLNQLPDGAILVNTARGALIKEDALLSAIDSGKLAGAGLDCFTVEPGGNPGFAKHENIFMLPHIGSATFETRDAMGFRALDNLDEFFAGRTPQDQLV